MKKNQFFKKNNCFGNISSSFGFVICSIRVQNVLVLFIRDVKMAVPLKFKNSRWAVVGIKCV